MNYDATSNQVLAQRWRRTRAILDQKGMEIHTPSNFGSTAPTIFGRRVLPPSKI